MAKKVIVSSVLIIGWVIFILAPSIFLIHSLSNQFAFGTFPGENGKIVFTQYAPNQSAGNNQTAGIIYVMNAADGSGQTMLTSSSADETWPSWSPDGTKIAFESDQDGNGNIYAMNAADGSNQIRLTNSTANDSNPRWSPDGTKIAFDSNA